MKVLRGASDRTRFAADNRGIASVEVTIILATLGVAVIGAGYVAGPVIKAYANRLEALVVEARCLAASEVGAPLPTNCPASGS